MAKKTPHPHTPRLTLAQLAKQQEELETTLKEVQSSMIVFERHYQRRGAVLVKIAKTLADELQLHKVREILEREMSPVKTEKIY